MQNHRVALVRLALLCMALFTACSRAADQKSGAEGAASKREPKQSPPRILPGISPFQIENYAPTVNHFQRGQVG